MQKQFNFCCNFLSYKFATIWQETPTFRPEFVTFYPKIWSQQSPSSSPQITFLDIPVIIFFRNVLACSQSSFSPSRTWNQAVLKPGGSPVRLQSSYSWDKWEEAWLLQPPSSNQDSVWPRFSFKWTTSLGLKPQNQIQRSYSDRWRTKNCRVWSKFINW